MIKAIHSQLRSVLDAVRSSLEFFKSSVDEARLANSNWDFVGATAIENCRNTLKQGYDEYVKTVSGEAHAISLEQAALLLNICNRVNHRRIVDFGSGFSSFVLRLYSKNKHVEVWSVDDNEAWLQKSIDFLKAHNLDTGRMMHSEDFFKSTIPGCFDVIYYDLGNMETRKEYLSQVLDLLSCDGNSFLVLDDVHKSDFRNYAISVLKKRSLTYYNLKRTTEDRLGRYAFLVVS